MQIVHLLLQILQTACCAFCSMYHTGTCTCTCTRVACLAHNLNTEHGEYSGYYGFFIFWNHSEAVYISKRTGGLIPRVQGHGRPLPPSPPSGLCHTVSCQRCSPGIHGRPMRIGHCRVYDIPEKIWNDGVPKSVTGQIRNWKEEMSKYPVHPLTELCKTSCKALLRDGLCHEAPRAPKAPEGNFVHFAPQHDP